MKFEITSAVQVVLKKIEDKGGRLYAVGGAVRDLLLKRQVHDVDLATDLLPLEVEAIVEGFKYPRIVSIRDFEHGIIRFQNPDTKEIVDIATLRKDDSCDGRFAKVSFTKDICEDLQRRDLTINAMAMEIDYTGQNMRFGFGPNQTDVPIVVADTTCERDLDDRVIRFVGVPEERILEDNLRMMRACRFMALSDEWKMGGTDEQAIIKHAELIKTIPKERIHDEFIKALGYPKPSNFFRALQKCGLLKHIIPDLELGVECEQNIYHRDTVWEHLLLTLDAACDLSTDPMFRLAAMTHDIAKPHTKEVKEGVGCTFYKHEVVGASLIYKWMTEYKFPKKDCEYISKLVRWHMFRMEPESTDKTIRKFLQEVGKETWKDLFNLRLADRKGNRAKAGRSEYPKALQELRGRIDKMIEEGVAIFKEDLAIDGKDLIELGVPPGPIYNDIFSNILGLVVADPSKNKADWLKDFVTRNYVQTKEEKEQSEAQ